MLHDFFPIYDKDGNRGYMYQDKKTYEVLLTYFDTNGDTRTFNYESIDNYVLAAAITGKPGELYYLLVEKGNKGNKGSNVAARLFRSKSDSSSQIRSVILNTASTTSGLDIFEISTSCSLVYQEANLVLYISRLRTKDNQNKNHQQSRIIIYESSYLTYKKTINNGMIQTTTWAANLKLNTSEYSDDLIRGVSIGGNTTRSINIWSIDTQSSNFVNTEVYHSKVRHSENEYNPDGKKFEQYIVYNADEKDEVITYKWSNDSQLYTELASPGFEETEYGYLIFFVGEINPLNNTQTREILNSPRSIGVQYVSHDLTTIQTNQLALERTNGTETGFYYDYWGNIISLTNTKVAWLTDYTRNLTENYNFQLIQKGINPLEKIDITLPWKNVHKLKHVKLQSADFMLIYEIWNQTDYQYTAYQVVDAYAAPLIPETKICYPIRLHRTESVILDEDGETVHILEAKGGFVNMYRISPSFDPYAKEDDEAIKTGINTIAVVIMSMIFLW